MHVEQLSRSSFSCPSFDVGEQPQMAPHWRVEEFESEVDAINYSVDLAVRTTRGLTQMKLADDMRIARAVLTKLRQGQIGVPASKFITFIRKTGNYALLQFYALEFGLVLKTRESELEQAEKVERLERENAEYRRMYSGVVGRGERQSP